MITHLHVVPQVSGEVLGFMRDSRWHKPLDVHESSTCIQLIRYASECDAPDWEGRRFLFKCVNRFGVVVS